MRPLSRRYRRPPVDRQGAAGRPRARVPHRTRGHALPRHFGRGAVQARLAARCRCGPAARESRRRRARAFRLGAGNAVARPDVRLRHDRDRGGTRRCRYRARTGRTFGFQKLAWFDGPTWQRLRQRARDRTRAAPSAPSIFASDIDPRAVEQCRRNAAAAGVTRLDRHRAKPTRSLVPRPVPPA